MEDPSKYTKDVAPHKDETKENFETTTTILEATQEQTFDSNRALKMTRWLNISKIVTIKFK